jgi:predicted enzyme related to lactoylglutathione lyase
MFNGAHVLFYTSDPESDRAFLRDVLGFPAVDTGDGWLILKLPPAEAGVHPLTGPADPAPDVYGMAAAQVYLLCADITATLAQLAARGVSCPAPHNEGWGIRTAITMPSGAVIGLYQPLHETALGL